MAKSRPGDVPAAGAGYGLASDGVGEQPRVVGRDQAPLVPIGEAEESVVVAPDVDNLVCRAA